MTTTILETRSKVFLQVQKVSLTDASITSARDTYLAQLETALKYGLPLDAEAMRFLIDYHNDSLENIEAFRDFLYADQAGGAPSRMANYINTLQMPATSELALLLCTDYLIPDAAEREALLVTSLTSAQTARLPPPAQAIATLGRTNPTQAAGFAKTYISGAADNHTAPPNDLLNALIALSADDAVRFIDAELREHWPNWDCKGLMEAYYKLNPKGTTTFANYAVPPGDIPDAFIVNPPPIEGWAAFATVMLNNATNNGQPLDAKVLADLQKVHPTAAAYVAWHKLTRQLEQRQNLDPQCLDVLHAYSPSMAKNLCVAALEDAYAHRAYLIDDTGGSNSDRITNAVKPRHRLELDSLVDASGKPVTAQIGDIVSLTSNGGARTSRHLSFADIANGYVDLEDSLDPVPPATERRAPGEGVTAMAFTLKAHDGAVKATKEPYYVTIDRTAPVVRANSTTVGVFTNHPQYSGWVAQAVFQIDDVMFAGLKAGTSGNLADNFYLQSDTVLDYSSGSGQPLKLTPAPGGIRVDTTTGRVEVIFQIPDTWPGFFVTRVPADLIGTPLKLGVYGLTDRAGNSTDWIQSTTTASGNSVHANPNIAATYTTAEPPARPLDHAALNKLAQIDPTLARIYETKFAMQNLIGPPPPPPPVVTDDDDNDDGEDMSGIDIDDDGKPDFNLNDDTEDLDLLTAIYMAQVRRAQMLDELLKQQMGVTQAKTDMIGKLHSLLGALNDLAGKVSATTEGNKKIKEILPDSSQYGKAIHAAMFAIPGGMQVFAETMGEGFGDGQGHFNPDWVTKEGLKGAIDKVRGTLDALANEQQLDMLRVQSLVTKRNEAFTLLTNFIEKYGRVMETILGNI